MKKKQTKGVTLVEIMVALVVALVIAIGMMSYQYAAAMNARKADMRATANRLGLLILDSWKAAKNSYPFNPTDYEPDDFLVGCGFGLTPFETGWRCYELSGIGALDGVPVTGAPIPFKYYRIFLNGSWFWVKLTYEDTWPDGGAPPLILPTRLLTAIVAWSDDVTDDSALNYDPMRCVLLSKYAKVAVEI